jgi:hypothetical protein
MTPFTLFTRQLYLLVLCADRAGRCDDDEELGASRTDRKMIGVNSNQRWQAP